MTIVDGNALANEIRDKLTASLGALVAKSGIEPCTAIIQITTDPSASLYTRRLQRTLAAAGIAVRVVELADDTAVGVAVAKVRELGQDPSVHAIQIQTPLPAHIPLAALTEVLDPHKDVDGIHPTNAGLLAQGLPAVVPATPLGGLHILLHHEVALSGARAVVVGRSAPVGRPMALLLLQQDATVTICHSRTTSLGDIIRQADVVAVAVGRPGLVTADMIRTGAAVIDFGTNVVDGNLVGDVEPAAADRASLFTPVPGGTGPVTNAMLLHNALALYKHFLEDARP
jgi:methylenetetrahydrofolate dehydrogenase (NADP+)/methenyltetrahydrofolate cyclohydrolase